MALITEEQRAALLAIAKEKTKATSFARQLAQAGTIYSAQLRQQRLIDVLSGAIAPPPGSPAAAAKQAADVHVVSKLPPGQGFHPNGYYFGITLDFALGPQGDNVPSPAFATAAEQAERDAWGETFEKDLTNPRKSCVYMVRCALSQLRVEPLLGGFILHWTKPSGWTWKDGQTSDIPVQVASNPLFLTRLVQSPATAAVNNSGFTVSVKASYP